MKTSHEAVNELYKGRPNRETIAEAMDRFAHEAIRIALSNATKSQLRNIVLDEIADSLQKEIDDWYAMGENATPINIDLETRYYVIRKCRSMKT